MIKLWCKKYLEWGRFNHFIFLFLYIIKEIFFSRYCFFVYREHICYCYIEEVIFLVTLIYKARMHFCLLSTVHGIQFIRYFIKFPFSIQTYTSFFLIIDTSLYNQKNRFDYDILGFCVWKVERKAFPQQ